MTNPKKGTCKNDYDIGRIQIDQIRSLFKEHIVNVPDDPDNKSFQKFIKALEKNNLYYDAEKYILTSIVKHFNSDFFKQVEIVKTLHLEDRRIQLDIFTCNKHVFSTIDQSIEVQVALIQSDLFQSSNLDSFNPIRPELKEFLLKDEKKDSDIFGSKILDTLSEDQLILLFNRTSFNNFRIYPDRIKDIFSRYPKVLEEITKCYDEAGSKNYLSFYNLISLFGQKKIYPYWFEKITFSLAKNYLKNHQSDENQVIQKLLKEYNPDDQVLTINDELLYLILNNYPKMLPEVMKFRELNLDQKILVMEKEKEIYEPLMETEKMITLNNHAYFKNYGSTFDEVLNNLKKSKVIITDL